MGISLIPGEFSPFTIAIAIISGFILFFGYVSMFIKEKLFISEACEFIPITYSDVGWQTLYFREFPQLVVALFVGIIAGPLVSNGFDPYSWDGHDEITKQLTRCIIAIQVCAIDTYS